MYDAASVGGAHGFSYAVMLPPGPANNSVGQPAAQSGICLGDLQAAPHDDMFVLVEVDPHEGREPYFVATHLVTHEQYTLPGGGWKLVLHEGEACFCRFLQGVTEARPAEDVFTKSMWLSSSGGMFARAGDDDDTLASWDLIRSKHRHGKISVSAPDVLV